MHGLALPDPGEPRFCGRCGTELTLREGSSPTRPVCPACGWTYYAKPALGAGILAEDEDGRVLLVQRAHEPYRGWWTLPSGYVEYGEDAAETAAREFQEETGLQVELTGFHGIFFGGGDPRGAAHLAVFTGRVAGGELAPADDAAEVSWFSRADVPIEIAFEANRKALGLWQRQRQSPSDQPILWLFNGTGPAPPLLVYAVIENPRGSEERIKYVDGHFKPTGERFPAPLPIHYGWIPRTICAGDGKELDVAVVGEGELPVGGVVAVRPIGAMLRDDGDDKVVALRTDLPSRHAAAAELGDVPGLQAEMVELFENRARLRGWANASETRTIILEAQGAWTGQEQGK